MITKARRIRKIVENIIGIAVMVVLSKSPSPIRGRASKNTLYGLLLDVVGIKGISALRAELGRISRILGLKAALVALVKRCACRSLGSAVVAEVTLVNGSA